MKTFFWSIVGVGAFHVARAAFAVSAPLERAHIENSIYATHGHCHGPLGCCNEPACKIATWLQGITYSALDLYNDCPPLPQFKPFCWGLRLVADLGDLLDKLSAWLFEWHCRTGR